MVQEKVFNERKKLAQLTLTMIIGYIVASVLLFFIAGDSFKFRSSNGNTELPTADSCTEELISGYTVEQIFSVDIQRLECVSVQWTTFYRSNSGTIIMELQNLYTQEVVMRQSYDASSLTEGGLLSLVSDEPIEGAYKVPFKLRIYTSDSISGSSPALLVRSSDSKNVFLVNGTQNDGTLCLSFSGSDYIWIGKYYWWIVAAGLLVLCIALLIIWQRFNTGKRVCLINAIIAVNKYSFLIKQLVQRDFKTKYKRSALGVFWSFLNPVLTMIVQYFVFSTIFNSDIPNYPTYLLIGVVIFNFFSESCSMSLTSIIANSNLITKVYVPKYIYPLTRVISSVINLGIALIPMVGVCLLTGVQFKQSAILTLFFFLCLIAFCLGFGLLLSTAMVFFRDMQFLWGVFSMLWMYATPIFYPESILPDYLKQFLGINPLYHILKSIRLCIIDGVSPEPIEYILCAMFSLAALLIGTLVFKKQQDKFVLYL